MTNSPKIQNPQNTNRQKYQTKNCAEFINCRNGQCKDSASENEDELINYDKVHRETAKKKKRKNKKN